MMCINLEEVSINIFQKRSANKNSKRSVKNYIIDYYFSMNN